MSELHTALVDALSEITTIHKGRTANAGSYSYDYADLDDIVSYTRPILAEHGIVALTPLGAHEGQLGVQVVLVHKSGDAMTFGPFPFAPGRDAQATGSAVTYHRRYALLAALGIATGDDDDGQKATDAARRPAKPPASPALAKAREAAKALGDSARTVVPSIIAEVTGTDAKLADLDDDELAQVTKGILRAATEEVVGGE